MSDESTQSAEFVRELIAICRLVGAFEREAVCCGTVTVQQCVVLQELLEGDRTVQEIATHTGVTSSATTRLADGLERNGWAERKRDDVDRRKVRVTLTDAGRAEAERLRQTTAVGVSLVLGRIPVEKQGQVLEALRLVRGAVEESRDQLAGCCLPAGC